MMMMANLHVASGDDHSSISAMPKSLGTHQDQECSLRVRRVAAKLGVRCNRESTEVSQMLRNTNNRLRD